MIDATDFSTYMYLLRENQKTWERFWMTNLDSFVSTFLKHKEYNKDALYKKRFRLLKSKTIKGKHIAEQYLNTGVLQYSDYSCCYVND